MDYVILPSSTKLHNNYKFRQSKVSSYHIIWHRICHSYGTRQWNRPTRRHKRHVPKKIQLPTRKNNKRRKKGLKKREKKVTKRALLSTTVRRNSAAKRSVTFNLEYCNGDNLKPSLSLSLLHWHNFVLCCPFLLVRKFIFPYWEIHEQLLCNSWRLWPGKFGILDRIFEGNSCF